MHGDALLRWTFSTLRDTTPGLKRNRHTDLDHTSRSREGNLTQMPEALCVTRSSSTIATRAYLFFLVAPRALGVVEVRPGTTRQSLKLRPYSVVFRRHTHVTHLAVHGCIGVYPHTAPGYTMPSTTSPHGGVDI